MTQHNIRVQLSNGDVIDTAINGTVDDVVSYYVGTQFSVIEPDGSEVQAVGERIYFRNEADRAQ